MSIKDHAKYEQAKSLLSEGMHSTRFVSKKLGIPRIDVSAMSRTVGLKGNSDRNKINIEPQSFN